MSIDSNKVNDLSSLKIDQAYEVYILATEWNEKIVAEQIVGASRIAEQLGILIPKIMYVPGAVELPYAAAQLAKNLGKKTAIIIFGAVVQGGTPHFEYVCNMLSNGIATLNIQQDIPIIFGVLTLNSEAQAWERLGGAHGHKGSEAMVTAVKMIAFREDLGV